MGWLRPGRDTNSPRDKIKFTCPRIQTGVWGIPPQSVLELDEGRG
jgi:hypothetical protein